MSQKMKIVQRLGDGVIVAWTALLSKDPLWRAGYLDVVDGKQTITLDTPEPLVLDNRSQSEMERVLMDENTKLKEMLRDFGWNGVMAPVNQHQPDVVAAPMAAGETELPAVLTPGVVTDPSIAPGAIGEIQLLPADPIALELTLPTPPTESPLPSDATPALSVEHITHTKLKKMEVESLIVHAHALRPGINLPDGAGKTKLAEICWDIQKESK